MRSIRTILGGQIHSYPPIEIQQVHHSLFVVSLGASQTAAAFPRSPVDSARDESTGEAVRGTGGGGETDRGGA